MSRDVRHLNPHLTAQDTREMAGCEDVADRLLAELRRLAPDIAPLFVRDKPYQTFKIDLSAGSLAIEVNGGMKRPGGGKHATSRDLQKMRQLALAGYTVLVFSSSEVRDDPLGCILDIRAGLRLAHQRAAALAAAGVVGE